jgi:hypothetical protein
MDRIQRNWQPLSEKVDFMRNKILLWNLSYAFTLAFKGPAPTGSRT